MKCNILHETPGRMRVHLALRRMSLREADLLEYDLKGVAGVVSVKVFDRTQDAVITYTCPRMDIVRALSSFSFTSERSLARLPEHTSTGILADCCRKFRQIGHTQDFQHCRQIYRIDLYKAANQFQSFPDHRQIPAHSEKKENADRNPQIDPILFSGILKL